MRFIDDDRVVPIQIRIILRLREKDSVGHHLDAGPPGILPVESNLPTDQRPDLTADLLRDPLGDTLSRNPPGLGVPDLSVDPTTQFKTDLGKLGGLAGPGLAAENDDLVVPDRVTNLVTATTDGKSFRKDERSIRRFGAKTFRHLGRVDRSFDLLQRSIDGATGTPDPIEPFQPTTKCPSIEAGTPGQAITQTSDRLRSGILVLRGRGHAGILGGIADETPIDRPFAS